MTSLWVSGASGQGFIASAATPLLLAGVLLLLMSLPPVREALAEYVDRVREYFGLDEEENPGTGPAEDVQPSGDDVSPALASSRDSYDFFDLSVLDVDDAGQ